MGLTHILGQDRALELLRRAIITKKLAGAYLFVGPEGVGKSTAARALALAANCDDPASFGCGRCLSCIRIQEGKHPDFLVLEPSGAAGVLPIEKVRDLIARLGLAPHEAAVRVVVVDRADRMSIPAANAILKTLEEPPSRTHFVLVTPAPDRLPATIRSRCQTVRFRPLETNTIAHVLVSQGVQPDRADMVAALAGGSVRRAADLAEGDVLERRWQRALGLIEAARSTTRSFRTATEAAAALADAKDDIQPTLELMACIYRDAAALAVGMDTESLTHRHHAAQVLAEAGRCTPPVLSRKAEVVLEAQSALRAFANPQLALEEMVLALRGG